MKIVDLHTHTFLSDGEVVASESVQCAKAKGYSGIAITDHVDFSNYESNLNSIKNFVAKFNASNKDFKVIVGGEITHVTPSDIAELTAKMRALGADIVVVHGETIMEPVPAGTNRAAILAGANILAHPGLISEEDVKLAAEKDVRLEITTRRGHSHTNGHIVALAKKHNAKLVVDNDAHAPSDYVGYVQALRILQGANLSKAEAEKVIADTVELFYQLLK